MFVDDSTIEQCGEEEEVRSGVIGATNCICEEFVKAGMQPSPTKNVVAASGIKLGNSIAHALVKGGVKVDSTTKALGVGMGAGRKRCVKYLEGAIA